MSKRRPVELVAHNSAWTAQAVLESERLKQELGDVIVVVHHIGSTSISGILAKPIIDLLPVVRGLELLDARADYVRALGYEWCGEFGIAGRRFCPLDDGRGRRIAHVHFYAQGSPEIARHLSFRDYLRAYPKEAQAYEAAKIAAAALHPEDVEAYTNAKSAFIEPCEKRAAAWAARR